jgi:hypothetical protein
MAKKTASRKSASGPITAPYAIHELELALAREKSAWRDWELRSAAAEIEFMRRVCRKAQWSEDYLPLVDKLNDELKTAATVIQNRDTTRITAMHSKLEQAVFDLRDRLYR